MMCERPYEGGGRGTASEGVRARCKIKTYEEEEK